MIRIHLQRKKSLDSFPESFAVQLNNTHNHLRIAAAELMRLFVDEHCFPWEQALRDHPEDIGLHQPHHIAGVPQNLSFVALCRTSSPAPGNHLPN